MKIKVNKKGKLDYKLNIFDRIDQKLEGHKLYDFYYDHIWCPVYRTFYFRPKNFFHNVRMFFQRGRLGYTHEDYWALNYYLAKYLSGVLRDWAKNGKSFPSKLDPISLTEKEWEYFLTDSANAFEEWVNIEENDPFFEKEITKIKYDSCMKRIKRFFKVLAENYETFWD